MKIIDRHNFWSVVCIVFTLLLFSKILLELIVQDVFGNYQTNIILMFGLSLLATFVLSQHYRFQKYPLLVVILGQYILLIGIVMLITWMGGWFGELHEEAYWDMFLSFTIPYVIGIIIYYVAVFHEVKSANCALKEIKEHKNRADGKR
ncbi:MAG: hypothetical protein HDR05_00990 [Lachnospiraceae bacterium]|nr:hypothetical protein [Lachnospiraceae bacterium]